MPEPGLPPDIVAPEHPPTGALWRPEIEALPAEQVADELERPRLARQLAHVLAHSPFYRAKHAAAGVDLEAPTQSLRLADLPFTEKSEIIADQVEHPPFGRLLSAPASALSRLHRTSGTSGRPVFVVLTSRDVEATLEVGARSFWCAGVRPEDTVVHCLNYCLWMGGLTDHLNLERTGALVVPYGVGETRNLLETIRHLGATAISCTPSYLARLKVVLREEFDMTPADLGLKKGLFGGEAGLQNPEFRQAIEAEWGIRAIDANYGMADVLSIFGSECEFRCGLHFHGYGVLRVELIDPGTLQPLEITQGVQGELVLTNLLREAQPMVRFRTRDVFEITGVGPCECGRTGFRFRVLGRSDDMLTVKGVNLFPNAVAEVIGRFMDRLTGEFQIRLPKPPPYDALAMQAEYRQGLDSSSVLTVRQDLEKTIRELLGISMDTELVPEGTLPRSEGKTRRVVKLYEE